MKAREYLGTPFHHQGRVKGVGIDCVGLLVGVAKELNLEHYDYTQYTERPRSQDLLEYIAKSCDPDEELEPGRILLFWVASPEQPTHTGITTDRGFIHTYRALGKVIEQQWTPSWTKHLHSTWRYRWLL